MCAAVVSGRSRNKEKGRRMQKFEQILLIIQSIHHLSVTVCMAANCSGMVCSDLSIFGNYTVRLVTAIRVSRVSYERGGAPGVPIYESVTGCLD